MQNQQELEVPRD